MECFYECLFLFMQEAFNHHGRGSSSVFFIWNVGLGIGIEQLDEFIHVMKVTPLPEDGHVRVEMARGPIVCETLWALRAVEGTPLVYGWDVGKRQSYLMEVE